jgi:hypothetical protein
MQSSRRRRAGVRMRPFAGRPRRTARAAAAPIAAALLVAACEGSPSVVAYSACMRPPRVELPRPNSNRTIPEGTAQQFGVSDSQYETARTAFAPLLTSSGGVSPPTAM